MTFALLPVLTFVLASKSAFAETATYDCGLELGATVTLKITPSADEAFYPLSAVLLAPGKDPASDKMLVSHETRLAGSSEVINGIRLFYLHDVENADHQIYAEIKAKGGAAQVDEVWLSGPKGYQSKGRGCKVTEFSR
ncbi:MAG: hypothetical protein NDJ89_09425 [Oligoflexia bacterium]|nr:hypothetical protein [Oligoflexia bacterium]